MPDVMLFWKVCATQYREIFHVSFWYRWTLSFIEMHPWHKLDITSFHFNLYLWLNYKN